MKDAGSKGYLPAAFDGQASRGGNVSEDINVLALVKGEERYLFLYNDENRSETLRTLGRYASNAELSFSWYDAAVLSQKVRNNCKTAENEKQPVVESRFEFPQVGDLLSDEETSF